MAQIRVTNLTFGYEGSYDYVFENVSFTIDTDWKLGFTGRNGRGKTTFLKLLMSGTEKGEWMEYSGSIVSPKDFAYFPYEVEEKERMTLEVCEGIYQEVLEWELIRELSLLQVDAEVLYRSFASLSQGEQTKVLLAVLFLKENSFLLIDEPTNHLDVYARKIVADYLDKKSGFLLVSHDRAFMDTCVDHILSINKANIEIQQGNFSSWYYNKQLQDNFEIEQNDRHKKEIRRLTQAAKRQAGWSDKVEASKIGTHQGDRGYIGAMSAKMMKRSKAVEKRREREIQEKEKLLKNVEDTAKLDIRPLEFHTKRLLDCRGLELFYGDKKVAGPLSFQVEAGERIAFTGKNGSGKSTLLKLICGEDITYEGEFFRAKGLKISFLSQDTSGLSGTLLEFERQNHLESSLFRAILRKLDFSRDQFEKRLSEYSEGQKKKVLIARSLCEQAHLYIWDEPLNYIDVISRIQIEELLQEYRITLLFVEHDQSFCETIADKVIELKPHVY